VKNKANNQMTGSIDQDKIAGVSDISRDECLLTFEVYNIYVSISF
jgi:hypothetical protein